MRSFDTLEEVLNTPTDRLPFPWELTRREFEARWYENKPFSFPVKWLRDPRFLNADPNRGVTIRQREFSTRSQEYIDQLKASVEKEGVKSPPTINMYKDGTFALADGTHRVLVAHELGSTYIPVSFTPNFLDYGGYDVVVKKAFYDEAVSLPKKVTDQFDWAS